MPELRGKTTRYLVLLLIIVGGGWLGSACRGRTFRGSVCELQGEGEISPFLDKKVIVQALVSADLEDRNPGGFFILDPDCRTDDPGSQGIFIQLELPGNLVDVGDEVRVRGIVQEIAGETRILSSVEEIEMISLGNVLPPAINLAGEFLRNPGIFEYENWEGMLVSFPAGKFLEGSHELDLPRILPEIELDPALQLVCLKNQTFALQLSSSREEELLARLTSGDQIQDVMGMLRQGTTGYLLEVFSAKGISTGQRKTSADQLVGSLESAPGQTETLEFFLPGTASGTLPAALSSTNLPDPTILPSPTYYPVQLLITEILPNPAGQEPAGEWVEIYNPESWAQTLTGLKLGDETSPTGKEGMMQFPEGYVIKGREVLVVARQAKAFSSVYGFSPDFEFENSDAKTPDMLPYPGWGRSAVQFSNSGDEVLLLDPWDGIVDLLVYGNSTAAGFSDPPPAPREGHSLERYPPERDRDRGGDWRERDLPSPGRLDRSPPTQSEPPTQAPSPTATLTLQPTLSATSPVSPSQTAAPEWTDTYVPTTALPPSLSPTGTPADPITPSPLPSLTSSRTPTVLSSATETRVAGNPSQTATPPISVTPSTSLTPTATATVSPVLSPTTPGTATQSITPSQQPVGTATPPDLEDPEILLNEIHADPDPEWGDANGDGQVNSDDDEFLEFVNLSDVALDLSGWIINDAIKPRYIFPDGTVLEAGSAVVIFGGGNPLGDFGGSQVFSAGSLGLNNSGDTVLLRDASGVIRLSIQYGAEGGENQSLTRSPDLSGGLPLVLHSEQAGSGGSLYSPGTKLDGVLFGLGP